MTITKTTHGWENSEYPGEVYPTRRAARDAATIAGAPVDSGVGALVEAGRQFIAGAPADPDAEHTYTTDGGVEVVVGANPVAAMLGAAGVVNPTEEESDGARRIARLNAAKAEAAAAKADPSTPTPNLDALRNGVPMPKTAKTSDKPVPGAAKEAGFHTVALKSPKHAEAMGPVLKGLESKVDGLSLLIKRGEQAKVLAAVNSALDAAKGSQFTTRLLTISYVEIRHAFPGLEDDRGQVGKLVTALHGAVKGGLIASWSTTVQSDGTLKWNVEGPKPVAAVGAREVSAHLEALAS